MPLLLVACERTQDMVEEPCLPNGRRNVAGEAQLSCSPFLPITQECAQSFCRRAGRGKEVHMIGHDHVATHEPAMHMGRCAPRFNQDTGWCKLGEKLPTTGRAYGQKEDWIFDPDILQAAQKIAIRHDLMLGRDR